MYEYTNYMQVYDIYCAHIERSINTTAYACIYVRLTALASEYGFALVADDTIGSFCNVDLFHSKGTFIHVCIIECIVYFAGYRILTRFIYIDVYSCIYMQSLTHSNFYHTEQVYLRTSSAPASPKDSMAVATV